MGKLLFVVLCAVDFVGAATRRPRREIFRVCPQFRQIRNHNTARAAIGRPYIHHQKQCDKLKFATLPTP